MTNSVSYLGEDEQFEPKLICAKAHEVRLMLAAHSMTVALYFGAGLPIREDLLQNITTAKDNARRSVDEFMCVAREYEHRRNVQAVLEKQNKAAEARSEGAAQGRPLGIELDDMDLKPISGKNFGSFARQATRDVKSAQTFTKYCSNCGLKIDGKGEGTKDCPTCSRACWYVSMGWNEKETEALLATDKPNRSTVLPTTAQWAWKHRKKTDEKP